MSDEEKGKQHKIALESTRTEATQPTDLKLILNQPSEQITIIYDAKQTKQGTISAEQSQSERSSDGSVETKVSTGSAAASSIKAQDILTKSEEELKAQEQKGSARETHNLLKSLKIITAIMLGKDKNKELARVLQTDKSFTSKQIKELEEQGLVKKEGEGRETKYVIDPFNLLKFLQTKVVIKWGKKEEKTQDAGGQLPDVRRPASGV